ncbi:MAG TPA: hypothetical protein VN451_02935, partial [Chitinophagaceae bacterium]|nr:hypothetical protein [Chitinophagaceae bacterium]
VDKPGFKNIDKACLLFIAGANNKILPRITTPRNYTVCYFYFFADSVGNKFVCWLNDVADMASNIVKRMNFSYHNN